MIINEHWRYIIWDNRCLIHSVNVDYPIGTRIHLRTLIKGNNN